MYPTKDLLILHAFTEREGQCFRGGKHRDQTTRGRWGNSEESDVTAAGKGMAVILMVTQEEKVNTDHQAA